MAALVELISIRLPVQYKTHCQKLHCILDTDPNVSSSSTAVDCGSLSNPVNGIVSYIASTYEQTATYSCNTGYNLVGSSSRRCSSTGRWSGSKPTCRGMLFTSLSNYI